jgi:hypothetical protein
MRRGIGWRWSALILESSMIPIFSLFILLLFEKALEHVGQESSRSRYSKFQTITLFSVDEPRRCFM